MLQHMHNSDFLYPSVRYSSASSLLACFYGLWKTPPRWEDGANRYIELCTKENSVEHTNSRTSSRSAQFMICVACSLTRQLFMMQIPKCRNLVLIQHPFQQTQENVDSRKRISHFSAARTPDNKFIIISHTAHTTQPDRLKTLHGFFSFFVPTQSCRRRLNGCGDIILYTNFFRDSTAAVREDSNNIIRSFWPPWKWKIISTLFSLLPSSFSLCSA